VNGEGDAGSCQISRCSLKSHRILSKDPRFSITSLLRRSNYHTRPFRVAIHHVPVSYSTITVCLL